MVMCSTGKPTGIFPSIFQLQNELYSSVRWWKVICHGIINYIVFPSWSYCWKWNCCEGEVKLGIRHSYANIHIYKCSCYTSGWMIRDSSYKHSEKKKHDFLKVVHNTLKILLQAIKNANLQAMSVKISKSWLNICWGRVHWVKFSENSNP